MNLFKRNRSQSPQVSSNYILWCWVMSFDCVLIKPFFNKLIFFILHPRNIALVETNAYWSTVTRLPISRMGWQRQWWKWPIKYLSRGSDTKTDRLDSTDQPIDRPSDQPTERPTDQVIESRSTWLKASSYHLFVSLPSDIGGGGAEDSSSSSMRRRSFRFWRRRLGRRTRLGHCSRRKIWR